MGKQWTKMAQEAFEVQAITVPRTYSKRVLLQNPTMDVVKEGIDKLWHAGVPKHAAISFQEWPKSDTNNHYIIAAWEEKPDAGELYGS